MDTTCPADPALAGQYQYTFGGAAPDFKVTSGQDVIKYGQSDGAIFRVEKAKDAPTIVSDFYIMWGKVEVVMKAAPGAGIVSSFVLESDDLDEIDWEWVGATPGEAQSNYFGKGIWLSFKKYVKLRSKNSQETPARTTEVQPTQSLARLNFTPMV